MRWVCSGGMVIEEGTCLASACCTHAMRLEPAGWRRELGLFLRLTWSLTAASLRRRRDADCVSGICQLLGDAGLCGEFTGAVDAAEYLRPQ